MLVIGLDPGKATGLAALAYGKRTPAQMAFYATCAEHEVTALLDWCVENLSPGQAPVLVVERFDLHMNKPDVDLSPKQVQGRVREWTERNEPDAHTEQVQDRIREWAGVRGPRVHWQMPQEKDSVTRPVLRNLGLWVPGHDNRHVRDATRHGVMYLQRALHMPTITKGWPE